MQPGRHLHSERTRTLSSKGPPRWSCFSTSSSYSALRRSRASSPTTSPGPGCLTAFPSAACALPFAAEGLSVELVRRSISPAAHGCHMAYDFSLRCSRQLYRNPTIFLTIKTCTLPWALGQSYPGVRYICFWQKLV